MYIVARPTTSAEHRGDSDADHSGASSDFSESGSASRQQVLLQAESDDDDCIDEHADDYN